jgi:ERCC4-related helicase
MISTEPLGLSANQWQFLSDPDKYVAASTKRELIPESTKRQFVTARDILARLNGSYGQDARKGVLLADDVGLGKTPVAALVAWVVACAGATKGRVRILAPNEVIMRRWVDELLSHVEPLRKCAPALDAQTRSIKARRLHKLSAGSIQVVKHSYATSDLPLACDLLIIDEAHRAKGEHSNFGKAIKRQSKNAKRILILTATPFSIQLKELENLLALIGGRAANRSVRVFGNALNGLYSKNASLSRNARRTAERLVDQAKTAVDALRPFVIRHGIDDLPREQKDFGTREEWDIDVPEAQEDELELMLRMDRALRVAKANGSMSLSATNDPRFHVGWRHFDRVLDKMKNEMAPIAEPAKAVVEEQIKVMERLRRSVGTHSKIKAIGVAVQDVVGSGEKAVLFCHHHATAQELTAHLASIMPRTMPSQFPNLPAWRWAWERALLAAETQQEEQLRETFIRWLCCDLVRAQIWDWVGRPSVVSGAKLIDKLTKEAPRHVGSKETIANSAQRLYDALLRSKSSRAVLKEAAHRTDLLPGENGDLHVLGVCESSNKPNERYLFIHNHQPDTLISIFNSPFGPEVLVVTDKLSEGIDLHRYCRRLIHYELDPSPIRTVQRNGRLRRVNSWSSVTGKPILYAYPAFRGTRDQKLVQVLKKRIDSFSLLLGGVQGFDVEELPESEEQWRNEVIAIAKTRLESAGGRLRAMDPAEETPFKNGSYEREFAARSSS